MKKILYVEDNEMNRDMLGRRLTRREYEVIFAFDGQEGLDRKLSISIQLSDKLDYEGGNFEFEDITSSMDFKEIGTIIIFPSYLRHRVTKVTSGIRRSLVAWFYGPNWK